MKLSNAFRFVFLLEIATPCSIPPLARYLYKPPTITSPKENGVMPRNEIKVMWTPTSPNSGFLFDVSYNLQVKKRSKETTSTQHYATKTLSITLPSGKYPEGKYLTRIAAIGLFGSGDWSKITKFEIVDANSIDEEGGFQNSSAPAAASDQSAGNKPGKKPVKEPVDVPFVSLVTARPEILFPESGATIETGELVVQWTKILHASGYLVRLHHVGSGHSMDYQSTHTHCDKCSTTHVGKHTVKAAGILKNKFGDWGEEIQFNVMDHLKAPRMISPRQNSVLDKTVEFEWSEVQGAEKYELLIAVTTTDQPITVETYYNFYNMWQVRFIDENYNVTVAARDSNRVSAWSTPVTFKVIDNAVQLVASSKRETAARHFMFQPVSTEWMFKQCAHVGLTCDNTLNRAKRNPIKIFTRDQPRNRGLRCYGGNSFYTTLSQAISESAYHHEAVRNFVIQELNSNYAMYLRDGTDLSAYSDQHSTHKLGVAPTDIEIVAAANALQTVIWIYDESRPVAAWIDYQPRLCEHMEAIYLRKQFSSKDYSVLYTLN